MDGLSRSVSRSLYSFSLAMPVVAMGGLSSTENFMMSVSSLAEPITPLHSSRQNRKEGTESVHSLFSSVWICACIHTWSTSSPSHKLPSFPPFSSRRSTSSIVDVRGVLKTAAKRTRRESRHRPRRPPLSTFTWSPSPRSSPSPPHASSTSSPLQGAPRIRFY